jgi:hypothetical protein
VSPLSSARLAALAADLAAAEAQARGQAEEIAALRRDAEVGADLRINLPINPEELLINSPIKSEDSLINSPVHPGAGASIQSSTGPGSGGSAGEGRS